MHDGLALPRPSGASGCAVAHGVVVDEGAYMHSIWLQTKKNRRLCAFLKGSSLSRNWWAIATIDDLQAGCVTCVSRRLVGADFYVSAIFFLPRLDDLQSRS